MRRLGIWALSGLVFWTALALLAKGLWNHDWRLIVAGAVTAVVWPFIMPGVIGAVDDPQFDPEWDAHTEREEREATERRRRMDVVPRNDEDEPEA